MYDWDRSDKLKKILQRLFKKDKVRYEAVLKKMEEVINSEDPDHYKNLSYELNEFKRVHVDSHFVLVFKFDKKNKLIRFEDLDHHDNIYKR
jgi:YafQ family addiction module toxin component